MASLLLFITLISRSYSIGLTDLSSHIDGTLLTESSQDYEVIRQQFDPSLSKFPSMIIQCQSIRDVKLSLQYILANDLDFVLRSGKHSFAGYSTCNGCVMIDLRSLNNIKIKEKSCNGQRLQDSTVSVQPGALINELFYELEYNSKSGKKYWLPAGVENVGIGGHIHGGGWGIGIRKYGMTMDNLVEAKVVSVDNKRKVKIKTASLTENSELFYCIRGTIGPSCGIVVEYTLKIYEQNENGYTLTKIDSYGLDGDYTAKLDKLSIINSSVSEQQDQWMMNVHAKINEPVNLPFIMTQMFYSFYDGDVVNKEMIYSQEILDVIQELNGIVMTNETYHGSYLYIRCIFQSISSGMTDFNVCNDEEYLKIFTNINTGQRVGGSLFDTEQEYDEFVSGLGYQYALNQIMNECPETSIFCGYYTALWGGKMNEIEVDQTAFPWRNTTFAMNLINLFPIHSPEIMNIAYQEANEWFIDTFTNSIYRSGYAPNHGYANYPVSSIVNDDEYMSYYYGDNSDDLTEAKCIWDPLNIFTNPQGIPLHLCGDDLF